MQVKTSAYVKSLQSINGQLRYQAMHDALTGMANRSLLFEHIQLAIDSAEHQHKKTGRI